VNQETLNQFLTIGVQNKASDVHLQVGEHPLLRINGQLNQVRYHPLTSDEMTEIVTSLAGEDRFKKELADQDEFDVSYEIPGVCRFRVNVFRQRGSYAAVLRVVPLQIKSFEELNLPNALTLIRILLVPVLVVALTVESPGGSTIAAIVFAIAALTDGLDGYIARSRQAITTFGKVMDPVADKLMIAAALISLVSLDRLEGWVAMVIIAREFAVSGLRIAAGQQGVVIPASMLGKAKTIVQVGYPTAAARAPKSAPGEARLPRDETVFAERWPAD